jgi:transposase
MDAATRRPHTLDASPTVPADLDPDPDPGRMMAMLPPETRPLFERLWGALQALRSQRGEDLRRLADLELQLKLREEQLRLERLRRYGPRGEKLGDGQMMLLALEPVVSAQEVAAEAALPESDKERCAAPERVGSAPGKGPRYARVHPGRRPLPAHLERREIIIPCVEGAGGELIGYEDKEELRIREAEFYVAVIRREKRRVSVGGQSTILTAPPPPRIVEKGQLGNSVVVELLVGKFCEHLPLYRQRMRWGRDWGVELDDALLIRAALAGGHLLGGLARAIGESLKRGPVIQADETRVPVLQREGRGRNDTAWLWQYSRPGGPVFFDYQESRSRAGPRDFLAGFTGVLQSDGYEVYTRLGREVAGHAGCWAHVRRKFAEAGKAAPKEAPCADSVRILGLIGGLYAVEREARELGLAGEERLALRRRRGVEGQLRAILGEVIAVRRRVLPASLLAKACDYLMGQWEKLEVYAREGGVEIDNNWCENAMRPVALGRRNWLHLGSQESGPPVAAIMTVIASAQRAGHNVRRYLADVFERLSDPAFTANRIGELLPENWRPAGAPAESPA